MGDTVLLFPLSLSCVCKSIRKKHKLGKSVICMLEFFLVA